MDGGSSLLQAGTQLAEPALVRDDRDGASCPGERGQAVEEGEGAPSHGSVVLAVLGRRKLRPTLPHLGEVNVRELRLQLEHRVPLVARQASALLAQRLDSRDARVGAEEPGRSLQRASQRRDQHQLRRAVVRVREHPLDAERRRTHLLGTLLRERGVPQRLARP